MATPQKTFTTLTTLTVFLSVILAAFVYNELKTPPHKTQMTVGIKILSPDHPIQNATNNPQIYNAHITRQIENFNTVKALNDLLVDKFLQTTWIQNKKELSQTNHPLIQLFWPKEPMNFSQKIKTSLNNVTWEVTGQNRITLSLIDKHTTWSQALLESWFEAFNNQKDTALTGINQKLNQAHLPQGLQPANTKQTDEHVAANYQKLLSDPSHDNNPLSLQPALITPPGSSLNWVVHHKTQNLMWAVLIALVTSLITLFIVLRSQAPQLSANEPMIFGLPVLGVIPQSQTPGEE